ncbi:MAG: FkbM family methyltransferase [Pseudolabrys sp.]
MKHFIKAFLEYTPYRIIRDRGRNRFQAIDASLRNMKGRGYRPSIVIDGGAHLGMFSLAAAKTFPDAKYHLIEPQEPCLGPLRKLCAKNHFVLHEFALSDQLGTVKFLKTVTPSTGAYVNPIYPGDEVITVPATTLDALFVDQITEDMRALLKLDIQGQELAALKGGMKMLQSIEVVLIEVMFLPFGPSIASIVAFFEENGFELYDIASLSGRMRDNRLAGGDLIFARRNGGLMADLNGG